MYFIEQLSSLKEEFYDKLSFRNMPCSVPNLESQRDCLLMKCTDYLYGLIFYGLILYDSGITSYYRLK